MVMCKFRIVMMPYSVVKLQPILRRIWITMNNSLVKWPPGLASSFVNYYISELPNRFKAVQRSTTLSCFVEKFKVKAVSRKLS